MVKERKGKTLGAKVPEWMYEVFQQEAHKQRRTISQLVYIVLEDWLQEKGLEQQRLKVAEQEVGYKLKKTKPG